MQELSEFTIRAHTMLQDIGQRKSVCENHLDQMLKILDEYRRFLGLENRSECYVMSAYSLRDQMFPCWPLAGLPYNANIMQGIELELVRVRSLCLLLAVAANEGTNVTREGAEMLFNFINACGYLPEDVHE